MVGQLTRSALDGTQAKPIMIGDLIDRSAILRRLRYATPTRIVAGLAHGALNPSLRNRWGGPMNGQLVRQSIVRTICRLIRFGAAVETGSFRGDSSGFIAAEISGPLTTIEADPFGYGFCKSRYLLSSKVRCIRGDSRRVLRHLLASSRDSDGPWFFYLDAHWGTDLPLAEEVDIVLSSVRSAVIMLDDFQVDGDDGYLYDDYGPGKRLSLDYINPLIERHRPSVFLPSGSSDDESGARRGFVLLATADLATALDTIPSLREC